MKTKIITAVGIDVSKGYSTIAVCRPGGELILKPFRVNHTISDLKQLVKTIKKIGGNIRIVMEHTGMYWRSIALPLKQAGFYVSVVNAILIRNFNHNSLRKIKTDKADAIKIANYAISFWANLREYADEDEIRQLLKTQSRLSNRLQKSSVDQKNGLISLIDQTFPGINNILPSSYRTTLGHYKWIDFTLRFWHKDCVTVYSRQSFHEIYHRWCKNTGYHFNKKQADELYDAAQNAIATFPKNESTKIMITQAINSLNAVYEALNNLRKEMLRLASTLPEYYVVMDMQGVGDITGPQLIAEIGDVRRFKSKNALVAFAGVDAPPHESGSFEAQNRHMSKRGSPHLRKALFLVCSALIQQKNSENPIYQFMDKKRSEGKHYYSYTMAGAAKFLRIYYARVKEYLTRQALAA